MSGDSEAPPTYYFSGITFNPSFYQSASDYLTKTTGRKYFLSYPKAQGDETIDLLYTSQISTPTPTENFNFLESQTASIFIGENVTGTANQVIQLGAPALTTVKCGALSIKDTKINNALNASSGHIYIGDQQISGDIYIGTGSAVVRSAASNISIGSYTTSGGKIRIGTSNTTTDISGNGDIYATKFDIHDPTGTLKFGDLQTTGKLEIGSGGLRNGTGAINIGIGGSGVFPITIGSSTSNTTLAGTSVSVSTKLITPIIDTDTTSTTLKIGSNIQTGNIEIGGALTSGDIIIGTNNVSGATITVGKSLTETTINGKLTSSRGVLSGNTAYAVYDSFGGNQTISTSLNVDAFIVIFGGLGSSIFTIPSGFPTGQRLTFKSIASNNQTLRFANTIVILSNGTQTGASDFVFSLANVLNVIFNGTLWYQT